MFQRCSGAQLGSQGGAQGAINTLQAVTPMLSENAEFCCTDSHHLSIKTIFLYGKYMAAVAVSKTSKHSLRPLHRSDKISKVGPDILLDLLHSLFLPSKIGKFSNSKKNLHSFVIMTRPFFLVCVTNTVLNILTVLLEEVGNVELLLRSGKWVLSTKGLFCWHLKTRVWS